MKIVNKMLQISLLERRSLFRWFDAIDIYSHIGENTVVRVITMAQCFVVHKQSVNLNS